MTETEKQTHEPPRSKLARMLDGLLRHPIGVMLADALDDLVSIWHLDPSDPRVIQVRDKVRKAIERACP